MAIGMSIPGLSAAGSTLGLGESEEERKKRLAAMAATQQQLSGALEKASVGGLSPAGQSLFGW